MSTNRSIKKARVCVAGGAGFLGSHLVNHLIEDRDCSVLVLDNLVSGRREFIHKDAKFVHCDICDSETRIRHLLQDYEIQYSFNYVAEPYIPVSFARPLHVFNTNAVGALQFINASQEAGCRAILQVSSAELYGGANNESISEQFTVEPHSSYGAAKAAIDFLLQARWKEAETPVISLRQFNCIGERETHPYVVPEIISQLSKSTTLYLGNNSSRDFLYAGDAVKMAVELLEGGQFGEVYNLGSSKSHRIYDIAKLIYLHMYGTDSEPDIRQDPNRVRPWEIWGLKSNNTKIHQVVNHRPEVTLRKALQRVINDYQSNGNRWCWE